MKILFTGDLFTGGDLLQQKNYKKCIKIKEFDYADIRIVNLENPISNYSKHPNKSTVYAPLKAVEILKSLNINAVCLANNHIQDSYNQGIIDTINILDKQGINFFGAGKNLNQARKPFLIKDNKKKIALFGYCEFGQYYLNQIQIATKNSPGVAPLNYENILEDIKSISDEVNKIILFFHWGIEHTWLPPYKNLSLIKKILKIKKVALIIGSHSHRCQGFIKIGDKYGFPGLGNFLFPNFLMSPPKSLIYLDKNTFTKKISTIRNYKSVNKLTYKKWSWKSRLSMCLRFDTNSNKIKIIPTFQSDNKPITKRLSGIKRKTVLNFIKILSLFYKFLAPVHKSIDTLRSKFVTLKSFGAKILREIRTLYKFK